MPPHPVVIRFGRLGDMILLEPLLRRLRRRYGEACIVLGPFATQLYATHPDVLKTVQVDARHRPLTFSPQRWRMLRVLRRERGVPVYVCEPEPRALAKLRRMLKLANIDSSHCVFITDDIANAHAHWADRLLRFGERTPSAFAKIVSPITSI